MVDTVSWRNHNGHLVETASGFDIIDCGTCGFIHMVPVPSDAELEDEYRKKYYTSTKPDYARAHEVDGPWWEMTYAERYDRYEQYLRGTGAVLDVGCGPGFFLKLGKERGWRVAGVEPSSEASFYARSFGVEVFEEPFSDRLLQRPERYDLIQIDQALEHFADPKSSIRTCWELLKPGGLLAVVVANDFSPFQKIARERLKASPWWIVAPEHINYFGPATIKRLLLSCGFSFVFQTTTFPIDMFLLMGDVYVGDAVKGRACHARRCALESALVETGNGALKRRLYEAFCSLGLGREIETIVRKPQ